MKKILFFITLGLFMVVQQSFAQATYYSKATATDFNDVNSWSSLANGTGISPVAISNADNYIIQNGATLSLSGNASVRSLTINAGTLTVAANTLTVEITSANNTEFNIASGGALNLSGGTIDVKGAVYFADNSACNQTGGLLTIDGNSGSGATSIGNGTGTNVLFGIGYSAGSGSSSISTAANAAKLVFTGGTIRIVDPSMSTSTTAYAFAYRAPSGVHLSFGTNHTVEFGDGISTQVGGHSNGFYVYNYVSLGYLTWGSVAVNTGTATNRFVKTTSSIGILGNLTITSGEYQLNSTTYLSGNLTNNGTLSSNSTLHFARWTNATASRNGNVTQTVSGTGIYKNVLTGTSTGNYFAVTVNTDGTVVFADANSLKNGANTGTTATLTLTSGLVNTSGGTFILGVSTATTGALTHTAGGFLTGSTLARWYSATLAGTTITASAVPTIGTGSYPFVTSTNIARHFHLQRPTTAGATGGTIAVTLSDAVGTGSIGAVVDGTYSVDKQSLSSWTVASGNLFAAGTGTFNYAIQGGGIYTATNTNGRLMNQSAFVGTHQAGTTLPVVQRTAIPAANYQGAFYIGISGADVPLQSVQSGPFEDPNTWGGTAPSCGVTTAVMPGHNVTVVSGGDAGTIIINPAGTLTVNSGVLNVGCTQNNFTLSNSGTLTVAGGTVNVNGNFISAAGSFFNQSGGNINVDGNSGTVATSVATTTPLVTISNVPANINLSGGTFTIVDPHLGAGTETAFSYTATGNYNTPVTHTFQFGNGGTQTGAATGYRILPGSKWAFGNLIVNIGTTVPVTHTSSYGILGNLTVTAGELQILSAGTAVYVKGNIINNGTISTTGTLHFADFTNATSAVVTTPQSISGAGVYRNVTTGTSTANFVGVTVNNNSTSGITFDANALLNGANTGTNSGALTFTNGIINTGSGAWTCGIATTTVGSISWTAGGFGSGSTLTRWVNTTAGSTITAATVTSPSANTGGFPFIYNSSNRNLCLTQTTASTGGKISVTYNANGSGNTATSITDASYTVETKANDTWAISTSGITGTPTYNMSISAANVYAAANGNSRIVTSSAAAAGTHQNGTLLPHAQRLAIPLANLTDTYTIGAANVDVPFIPIASGSWSDAAIWNKGVTPGCSDVVLIPTTFTVNVASTGNVCQKLTINSGGTLNVSSGDLTVGCTLNNNEFNCTGTLNVSGGTMFGNGRYIFNSGATFNQTGGDIIVDGNNNGDAATSVPTAQNIFRINTNTATLTGGKITVVDPHVGTSTGDYSFGYGGTVNISAGLGHTVQFGNGTSTDPTTNTNGFYVYCYVSSGYFSFGNLVIDMPAGTNRFVKTTGTIGINGNLTINQGDYQAASTHYVGGNFTNNATFTPSTSTFGLGTWNNATAGATSVAQTISSLNPLTISSLSVNNTSASGVTLNTPITVSSTLTMTAGLINTSTANMLTLGTATAAGTLSGTPSATNMIQGPFTRGYAIRTATGTYSNTTLFPVGKNSVYSPIFIDPTITNGVTQFTTELFDGQTLTAGVGVTGTATKRWESTCLNTTNQGITFVRLGDSGIASGKAILSAGSSTGTYEAVPGLVSTYVPGSPNTLTTSPSFAVGAFTGFYTYGDLTPCPTPTGQATAFVSSTIGTTTASVSYTDAATPPSGYLVVRYTTGTPVVPVNGTTYTSGVAALGGTIAYVGSAVTFNETALTANTNYTYYVYTYNAGACFGPSYNTATPLTGTFMTCATATSTPTTLAATAISASGFTANWNVVAGATYELDVATNTTFTTFVPGYQALSVATNTQAVTGLTANTPYYYRVKAIIGGCYSANSATITATTDCGAYTVLPHTEDFATVLITTPPVCWKNFGQGGTPATGPTVSTAGSWTADGFANVGTTGAVKVNIYTNTKKSWLISPTFDLSTGAYILKYKVGLTAWNATTATTLGSDDEVQVLVSSDNGTTWTSVKTYNASTPVSNTGTNEIILLTGLSSANTKIAFWVNEGTVDDSQDNDFFLDDFAIEVAPSCIEPSTNGVTDLLTTSATANWIAVAGAAGYNWELRTPAAAGGTVVSSGSTTTAVTTSLTGLTSATPYEFFVQTDCGSGLTSVWAGPIVFSTKIENDECSTARSLVVQPFTVSGCTAPTIGTTLSASQSSVTIPPSSAWSSSNDDDAWYSFTATNATHVVRFCNVTYPTGAVVGMGYGVNAGCVAANTELTSGTATITGGTGQFNIPNLTIGNTYYVRILTANTSSRANFEIEVQLPDPCALPTLLTASPASTTAVLSWNENGSATSWEIEVVQETTPGSAIYTPTGVATHTATTKPFQVTGLSATTNYRFLVRGVGCTPWSAVSAVFLTTATPPSNDEITDAIPIVLGGCSGFPYTNVDASMALGEIIPACWGSTANGKSVWYSFVAPASGLVKVSLDNGTLGTLTDSHIGIYAGPATGATYTNTTLVACDEDGGTTGSGYSGVTTLAVIPNNTYYLQVAGYNGTSGTFCIEISDATMLSTGLATAASCATVSTINGVSGSEWINFQPASTGLLSVAINPRGQSLGNVTVTHNVNASTNPIRVDGAVKPYLDRNWAISSTSTFANPVGIRVFFTESEWARLVAAPNGPANFNAIGITHVSAANCSSAFNFTTNPPVLILPNTSGGNVVGFAPPAGGVGWIEFDTPSFSTFWINNSSAALPITLKSFTASAKTRGNEIIWETTEEKNVRSFVVEKSIDGKYWTSAGTVTPNATKRYSMMDMTPFAVTYYRLKNLDNDGRQDVSNVISVKRDGNGKFAVEAIYPNPTDDNVNVNFEAPIQGNINITLIDILGKVVYSQNMDANKGINQMMIPMSNLPVGTYILTLHNGERAIQNKVTKQ